MAERIQEGIKLAKTHWKRELLILALIAVIAPVVCWAILPQKAPYGVGFDSYSVNPNWQRGKTLWGTGSNC